jgi:hypothetical protein
MMIRADEVGASCVAVDDASIDNVGHETMPLVTLGLIMLMMTEGGGGEDEARDAILKEDVRICAPLIEDVGKRCPWTVLVTASTPMSEHINPKEMLSVVTALH